jgi:hypothetical protein
MTKPKHKATVPSVDSIVQRPWEFACEWYGVDEIHYAIKRENRLKQVGDLPPVPKDVESREFAEWLTNQYRLAMRKGAEMATREIQGQINEIFRR